MSKILDRLSYVVVTCVFEPLRDFRERITEVLRLPNERWEFESGLLDLPSVYFPRPQVGGAKPVRAAMWTPCAHENTTMFYANSPDGWPTLIRVALRAAPTESLSIRSTLPGERWQLQEVEFRGAGAETRRLIRMQQEEKGMRFYEQGIRLPFERVGVDAFCERSDVLSFVRNLNVDLSDDRIWESDSLAWYLAERRV